MTNTMMTLDTAMQDLITKTVAAAETAGDFVVQEAPIVVEQLLAWNFTISLIGFVAGVALITALLCNLKKARVSCSEGGWAYKTDLEGAVIVPMVACAGLGIALVLCNTVWLKIAIAPKLYLLEYAADLIK